MEDKVGVVGNAREVTHMTRHCKACGAPIHYADIDRRYPLDEHGGHVCLSRLPRYCTRCGCLLVDGVNCEACYRVDLSSPRVREQRKGREGA